MSLDVIAGRYRVKRAVGKGGMGTVWLCHDEMLNRDVAIKQIGVLPGESADDARRAMREARTAAALNHRNAVSIYDVVDHDGAPWLVMEYVASKTLSELMAEEGALDPARVAGIGAQVAAALASAHALGIIHRDVKPSNILVGEDDLAKISDFGIARIVHDEQLTQTGLMTGTPAYFSPELARGGEAGAESDVWALGATLYAAVEGRPPYPKHANPIKMLTAIASEPVDQPRRAEHLLDPIGHMMDRDPSSRWTMERVERALREAADGPVTTTAPDPTAAFTRPSEPAPVPPPQQRTPAPPRTSPAPPPRRSRILPLVFGVALLVLVIGGYFLVTNLTGNEPSDQANEGPTGPTGEPTEEPTGGSPPSPSESPPQESATEDGTPTEDATPSQSVTPRDADAARIGTVESYFETVTSDLDAGWSLLSPGMQQEVGRESYDGFWSTIQDVQVEDARRDGADAVLAQITYTSNDGNVSVEQKRFTLVRGGTGFLIDDEQPVG